ncbi:MAG: ABC transporter permease [Firmicutes bacterium]|nr:ABC transporter permease [Bacillota bacterium]
MIHLIRYEFIKQFCKRSLLALFVVFSIANLFKIYGEYRSYSYLTDGSGEGSWHTVHWQLYEDYKGEITWEKMDHLLAIYQPLMEATSDMTASTATDDPNTMTGNLYSDRNLLDKYFVEPMEYFHEYSGRSEQVADKARQNAALYAKQGAIYKQRESGVIYHLYTGRIIPAFAYREMCNYYLNYDFSIVLTLMLSLYGVIGTFVSEKETQMDMLLLVSPNGGRKTTLAKIFAVTIFLFLTSLWFSLLDLIGFAASFQTFEGLALPVFAIPNFAEASVNISIFQYALLSAALKCVGVWVIGLFWLLISMFWKNALLPFVINFALCIGLTVSGAACAHSNFFWMKVVNPYSLLTNRGLLGKTEFVNLGGFPVLTWQVAVWFAFIAGLVAFSAVYFLSAENYHRCIRRTK